MNLIFLNIAGIAIGILQATINGLAAHIQLLSKEHGDIPGGKGCIKIL